MTVSPSFTPCSTFPAALQGAVIAYKTLLNLCIPASQNVISGDSAGGNLALELLRYIVDEKYLLPTPGGVVLWSPWGDLAVDFDSWASQRNSKPDFISPILGYWASRVFKLASLDAKNSYIAAGAPFCLEIAPLYPMWHCRNPLRRYKEILRKYENGPLKLCNAGGSGECSS